MEPYFSARSSELHNALFAQVTQNALVIFSTYGELISSLNDLSITVVSVGVHHTCFKNTRGWRARGRSQKDRCALFERVVSSGSLYGLAIATGMEPVVNSLLLLVPEVLKVKSQIG